MPLASSFPNLIIMSPLQDAALNTQMILHRTISLLWKQLSLSHWTTTSLSDTSSMKIIQPAVSFQIQTPPQLGAPTIRSLAFNIFLACTIIPKSTRSLVLGCFRPPSLLLMVSTTLLLISSSLVEISLAG